MTGGCISRETYTISSSVELEAVGVWLRFHRRLHESRFVRFCQFWLSVTIRVTHGNAKRRPPTPRVEGVVSMDGTWLRSYILRASCYDAGTGSTTPCTQLALTDSHPGRGVYYMNTVPRASEYFNRPHSPSSWLLLPDVTSLNYRTTELVCYMYNPTNSCRTGTCRRLLPRSSDPLPCSPGFPSPDPHHRHVRALGHRALPFYA